MPRIDPLQLLNCLQVLLSPSGGILSKNEVHRLASLMTKFSKKLVSKCVYVLILKNTEVTLLGLFMAAGGWTLIHLWLHDAIYTMNWALVKELLELLLITPVDVERLKSNNIPKLVKSLSKREDLQNVHELSNQLVQQWLKIVKDETQSEQQKSMQTIAAVDASAEFISEGEPVKIDQEAVVDENTGENDESDSGIGPQTFYKLTLKDGKHLISKVGASDTNYQVLENVEVVEMKDEDDVKEKEKKDEKKKSHDKNKHKSSSSSKSSSGGSNSNSSSGSSRDKDKSSRRDKDKSRHSSSSKDKDRNRDKYNKHDKSKDRHRSNGSVNKTSSKSSNSHSNNTSNKDKEKRDTKEKQAEKDKDTLSKIQPQILQKLPKIPKKSAEDKEKSKDSKKDDAKKGTMSVEVRKNNEERPKTVKVYKSKMRSTGLEEEAKPAPPRPTKKPASVPMPPPSSVPPLKRSSPIRDTNAAPPEKKPKVETPLERPGAIKLIPPKPKPAVLQESDMFMDALTASATTKKEPKKRKRRASVSKDSTGSSPPPSPSNTGAAVGIKNLTPPKFYQDTLETDEPKTDEVQNEASENPNANCDKESESENPTRASTPIDATTPEEEESKTINSNGLKGVLVYVRRKGPKKSIKWKPDDELVDIQYFELDETERVNVTKTFMDMAKMDVRCEREAIQMSRKLPNEDVMDVHTMWRIPYEIELPEPLAEPGCKSLEKDIQFAREKSVLQSLYFNKKMLPEAPAEPDPEIHQVKDPIVIPVDAADNPDHDFRDTPWPEPKGSPPPPNIQNNVPTLFPTVQGAFTNFIAPPPNFPNVPNVQSFARPPFLQQNLMAGGGEWNNANIQNIHPQIIPRNMPPPEILNQGGAIVNPNIFIQPQENFSPMMNENEHRFPPPFNQQGQGMFPPNNFNMNRGGHGGYRRGGGNGPWVRMNGPSPGNWNNMRNSGGPHRGRICNHYRNKGFCKNRDNCAFYHPNN